MDNNFQKFASIRKFISFSDPRTLSDFGRKSASDLITRQNNTLPLGIATQEFSHPFKGLLITPREKKPSTLLIYIHGGGLVYYDTRVFQYFLSKLAAYTQIEIIALDYPKAPETESKTILVELHCAIKKILEEKQVSDFLLAGDSVGGYLALDLSLKFPINTFKSLHLIYPVIGRVIDEKSPYASGFFLDASLMQWFYTFIDPIFDETGNAPIDLSDKILKQLPAVSLHIAQCDILASDARVFSKRLESIGRLSSCTEYMNFPHDFCLYSSLSPDIDNAIKDISNNICNSLNFVCT